MRKMKLAAVALAVVASAACSGAGKAHGKAFKAEWRRAGELQIASLDSLGPQMNTLAAKAQFPVLPMIVPQFVSQSSMGEKFGEPRKDADWGMVLFYDGGEKIDMAWAWPLGEGGRAAWEKSHATMKPGKNGVYKFVRKLTDDEELAKKVLGKDEIVEYGAFSPDGKWAFVSESANAASLAAASKEAPFAKPLKKGMACFEIYDRRMFENAGAISDAMERESEKMRSALEAATGKKGKKGAEQFEILPEDFPGKDAKAFSGAVFRELSRLRVVVGVSKTGLDLRVKATPAAGGELAGFGGALPKGGISFAGVPSYANVLFTGASARPSGRLGAAWDRAWRGAFKMLEAHYSKWCKKIPGAAELVAFKDAVAFCAEGLQAFADSPAKSRSATFFMAENMKGKQGVEFAFDLEKGPVGFAKQAAAQKKEGVLNAVKTDTGKRFAVGCESAGFKHSSGKKLAAAFAAALPEAAMADKPLFAARYGVLTPSAGGGMSMGFVWLFGWLDSSSAYHTIVRIPSKDISKVVMVLMGAVSSDGAGAVGK